MLRYIIFANVPGYPFIELVVLCLGLWGAIAVMTGHADRLSNMGEKQLARLGIVAIGVLAVFLLYILWIFFFG